MKGFEKILEKFGHFKETVPSTSVAEGPEKIIIVMGVTGSGKSTLINRFTGKNSVIIGHSLESATKKIEVVDWTYKKNHFKLVDTPGFDDTYMSPSEILEQIADFLQDMYKRKVYVNGILYLHPLTGVRFTGSALRQLAWMRKLVGDDSLKNVILVTTFWDTVNSEIGRRREEELAKNFWKPLVDRGARMARSANSQASELKLVDMVLTTQKTILDLQRELVDEKRTLLETAAGEDIAADIRAEIAKFERRFAELRDDIKGIEAKGDSQSDLDREELEATRQYEPEVKMRIEELKDKLSNFSSYKSNSQGLGTKVAVVDS